MSANSPLRSVDSTQFNITHAFEGGVCPHSMASFDPSVSAPAVMPHSRGLIIWRKQNLKPAPCISNELTYYSTIPLMWSLCKMYLLEKGLPES